MSSVAKKIHRLCCLPGRACGWLIFPLILFICFGVLGAKLGLNTLLSWGKDIPVLGDAITLNSLLDIQWYIFALLVLFGGVCSFVDNQHVKVDLFSATFSERTKAVINLIGDLAFLLPFTLIVIYYGTKFAHVAYVSGEGSTYGGLQDRWLIKACLPISFGILLIAVLARVMESIKKLFSKSDVSSRGKSNHD